MIRKFSLCLLVLLSISATAVDEHELSALRLVAPGAIQNKKPQQTYCICHFMAKGNCAQWNNNADKCWGQAPGEGLSFDCTFHFDRKDHDPFNYKKEKGICLSNWEADCDEWIKDVVENGVCKKAKKLKENDESDEGDPNLAKLFEGEKPERIWYQRIGHGRYADYTRNQGIALVTGYPDTKTFFVDDGGCSVFEHATGDSFKEKDQRNYSYAEMFHRDIGQLLHSNQAVYVSGNQCIAGAGPKCSGVACHTTSSPITFAIKRGGTVAQPHPCRSDGSCHAGETGICQLGDRAVKQICCETGLPLTVSSGTSATWRVGATTCDRSPDYKAVTNVMYQVPADVDGPFFQEGIKKAMVVINSELPFMAPGKNRNPDCKDPKQEIDDKRLTQDIAKTLTQFSADSTTIIKSRIWFKRSEVGKLLEAGQPFTQKLRSIRNDYLSRKYCVARSGA